jgi:RES domain-containing protein
VDELPTAYQLLAVEVPDDIADRAQKIEESLPANWRENLTTTRGLGSDWLISLSGALLQVPSAIVPRTTNWLLNPLHEDAARISILEIIRAPFDPRLLRQSTR